MIVSEADAGASVDSSRETPSRPIVVALFSGVVSTAVIYDALPPVLPAISRHYGGGAWGEFIAQLSMTLPLLGIAVSGLFSGLAIERFGIKRVLVAALVAFAVLGSAGAMVGAVFPFLILRFLTGSASGTLLTCCTTLIASNYAGPSRLRLTSRTFAAGAICSISFVQVAGFFAFISWRAPFLLHAVVGLGFLPAALMLGGRRSEPVFGLDKADRSSGGARLLWPAVPGYCYIYLLNFISFLFCVEIVFLLASVGVTSSVVIANTMVGYALAALSGNILVNRVDAKIGTIGTIVCGILLMALALVICALGYSLERLVAGAILGGLGTGLSIPATISLIMRSVPVALSARALGLGTSLMYFGGGSAPFILAPARSLFGLHGLYYFGAGLMVAAVLPVVLIGVRARRQQSIARRRQREGSG